MMEVTGMVFWGLVALVIVTVLIVDAIELVRRWFVKVEYPCKNCGSRFTTLHGKNFGISTGTYYAAHCLACGHKSDHAHSYYRGTGRWCGKSVKGWERKSLAEAVAEDRKYDQPKC
jgi:DNA-directed RNA polymerase subunit RPC12/RpoP